MSSTTSKVTIEHLRMIFAQHGLPKTIVLDNGSSLVCDEFETFLMSNGIAHVVSSLYHPATNGLAEKAVQILKNGLKKIAHGSLSERLSKFLFNYRLNSSKYNRIVSCRVTVWEKTKIQTGPAQTKHGKQDEETG